MSFFRRALLQLESPFMEFKRFRGKINIRRPRKPHYARQLYLDLAQPVYPFPTEVVNKCGVKKKKREIQENPFETILAKECANWFNHSKMVGFFHKNSILASDRNNVFVALKKQNMHLRNYGKKIVELAVNDSPYEAVKTMFICHTIIVFSEEIKPDVMLKIMRKTPQLVLIGGIIDGRFLSKNEFVAYSEFPSLDVLRSNLCNVLQSSGLNVVNQMTQHHQTLVGYLDQFVKMNSAETETKDAEDSKSESPVTQS